jgi:hypothetical protein
MNESRLRLSAGVVAAEGDELAVEPLLPGLMADAGWLLLLRLERK